MGTLYLLHPFLGSNNGPSRQRFVSFGLKWAERTFMFYKWACYIAEYP